MTNCLICNDKSKSEVGQKNSYSIFRCDSCGFVFVDPMPGAEILRDHYEQYGGNQEYLDKAKKKVARARRRLRRIKPSIPANAKTFLDIGCNVGCAVEAARMEGYKATGIDLDSESVGIAKKTFPQNSFKATTVQQLAKGNKKFDIIYCSEVIEHVPDAKGFAKAMCSLLSPNGIIYLTTPDAGHFRTPKNFTEWGEVAPPDHVCYFNKKNLEILLKKYGIKKVRYQWNIKPGIRAIAYKC